MGAPSSLHGTFRHPSSSVWMHLSSGTRENVLLRTRSLPFILLFPHSLNPTLLFSVSLIFTLLRFTNTDSFLVAVLGHVFLCYPAASSRWDCSRYISDKSQANNTTMYSLYNTRCITSQCQCHIFPSSYVKIKFIQCFTMTYFSSTAPEKYLRKHICLLFTPGNLCHTC